MSQQRSLHGDSSARAQALTGSLALQDHRLPSTIASNEVERERLTRCATGQRHHVLDVAALEHLRQSVGDRSGAHGFTPILRRSVGLVSDVTDEHLEHVFECRQPDHVASVVDDDTEMRARPAHRDQHLVERLARGQHHDTADACERQRTTTSVRRHGEQILGMHEPDDAVEIAIGDQQA